MTALGSYLNAKTKKTHIKQGIVLDINNSENINEGNSQDTLKKVAASPDPAMNCLAFVEKHLEEQCFVANRMGILISQAYHEHDWRFGMR
ncbi:hypothetical protein CEXT_598761 [Caerostris extrusa]|uniref:Uncharacterized protein n=1 Tax=Caerostris extrusa TaxID=172846 RepID=A0AAV4VA15_CAEEX|nr:hypothetical protein CEXT_598761 [Caerostris extrusa]